MNCMVGSKEKDKFDLTINLKYNNHNSLQSFIPQVWLASNFSLHYYSWFEYEDHENKGIDYQFKKFLIVKQFLLSQY